MHLPELEVDHLKNCDGRTGNVLSTTNEEFVKAWDEAHRVFRKKNKNPQQILPSLLYRYVDMKSRFVRLPTLVVCELSGLVGDLFSR
jgi:hypothetical protein